MQTRTIVWRFSMAMVMTVGAVVLFARPGQQPTPSPTPAQAAQGGAPTTPGGRLRPSGYPGRPPVDPAVVASGKALYGVNCQFCHGADARGGDGGGPNLIRSELVLEDQHGELITPVVQNGRVDQGMPKFQLTREQISDIAAFIHHFPAQGYDISRAPPPSILVGDAKAGERAFQEMCASCHSVSGDLKDIGAKFKDPKQLQNSWIMPGAGGRARFGAAEGALEVKPVTVTVTSPGGKTVEGTLVRIDDFVVTLIDGEGYTRSFRRDGDVPNVELHNPLEAHLKLLPTYSDKDIHDLTAYLVTVK